MTTSESHAEEIRRLRNTMRDLVAFSTLPAIWAGRDEDGVAGSFAEILLNTLALDLVYVRFCHRDSHGDIEVALSKAQPLDSDQIQLIAKVLAPWLTHSAADLPPSVVDPLGSENLRVAVARFGHVGDVGVVIACSRRNDFPSEADRLLLSVGTNQTAIVLQRKRVERSLSEERVRLKTTLSSIGDAVIATDVEGRVTFLNGVAESLTGWPQVEAAGRFLPEVFHIVNEHTRRPAENPALRALHAGTTVGLANHTILIARDGTERPIDDSAAPIRVESSTPVGAVLVFRDVTERKLAEGDRTRLAAIVESSDDAIISKSLDGIIRSWNSGAERLFGYRHAEAVGQPITLIIPPEHIDEERAILEQLRRGERIEHFETVRVGKDGRRLDVSITISPLRDGGGHIIGASKIARDITQRKLASEQLLASEQRFRMLFEMMGEGFCVVEMLYDANGQPFDYRFLEVNPTFERHTGLKEAVGRTILEMVPGHDAHWFEIYGRVAATGEPVRFVNEAKAMGRWYEVYAYRPGGPDSHKVALLFSDITVRKRAEERERRAASDAVAAAEANAKFRTFFEQGTSFAGLLALDGTIIEANRLCLEAGGFRRDEVIGKPFWECGWWNRSPDLMDLVRGASRQAAEGQMLRTECVYLAASGDDRVMDLILAPVKDETGRVLFVAATGIDITERKAMEDMLREADRKKDDFIALLAHELRNPLAPIRNGLQVLRLARRDPASSDRARAMMDRQLSHMVRLIDDLLDVSRIGRNKMELRRERVSVADVIANAVETVRPVIEEAGHDLIISLPQRPVFLDADLTRLSQVFSNLLTNSAKYTERGGRIWLSAGHCDGTVVVSVRDNGIGIPAKSLPTIFDMFSQVDRPIERSAGGLGIGLALVKGLVEMHNGTVTAESAGQGLGSTFTVTMPSLMDEAETTLTAKSDDEQATSGPKRRILVVDDNRDGADSLAMMLELFGNEIATAHDGIEAVERAEQFRPEVILMDVGMPKLNGLDAARCIRAQPWGRGITIIALTGWGQENDRERTRDAGCDGHLVKPVSFDDLQKLLGEMRQKQG
jgi:PAS domain S-box-containing protein